MKSLVKKKIAQHHYYLNLKSPFLLSGRLYYILEEGIKLIFIIIPQMTIKFNLYNG